MANVIEYKINGKDAASPAFKSASASVVRAAKAMAKASIAATKIVAAGAATAGVAVFAMSQKVAASQDRVQKMSDRLGIAVGKLSEFHHAAELGGVRTRTFDMAIQRLSRRVAEAAQGTGEAQGAIRELGLDAAQLARLPLDQQMEVVADSLQGVTSQSDKVRLAFKLFDAEGVAMLQTMKNGSESFKDAAADLERLGGVMTAQGTANAAKFNDEWTRVKAAISGVTLSLGSQFLPMLSGVFRNLSDFIADNRVNVVNFVKGFTEQLFVMGAIAGQVFGKIREFSAKLFDGDTMRETLISAVEGFQSMLTSVADLFRQAAPHLAMTLISGFRAGWAAFKELGKSALDNVFDFITGNNIAKPFGEVVADAVRAANEELVPLKFAMGEVADVFTQKGAEVSNALQSTFGINMQLANEQAQQSIDGILRFGEVAKDVQDKSVEAAKGITDIMNEKMNLFVMTQTEITTAFVENLAGIMQNTVSSIGAGIADIIVDGKNAVDVFKGIIKTVFKQLISSYVAMKIQRLLFGKTEAATSIGLTGANTMASMSLAPFPINLTAPAVAASHMSIAAGLASSMLAGIAHGGLQSVPAEATYLLQQGERVLSPNQNRDLTSFLDGQQGAGGGDVTVNVFTTASNFRDISPDDTMEFVAGKIIPAMDRLDRQGVRPLALERGTA